MMIKVVWHYATIASIEIFRNKQEIEQHKFRLIRNNETITTERVAIFITNNSQVYIYI